MDADTKKQGEILVYIVSKNLAIPIRSIILVTCPHLRINIVSLFHSSYTLIRITTKNFLISKGFGSIHIIEILLQIMNVVSITFCMIYFPKK